MSNPFTIPTPPIELRRDIQAYQVHHEQSTRKRVQDTIKIFLDALQHHDPVARSCEEYTKIERIFSERLQLVTKIHCGPGARYHFIFMWEEFEKVKDRLYRDADQAGEETVGGDGGGGEDIWKDASGEMIGKLDKNKGKAEDEQGEEDMKEQDIENEASPVAGSKKNGKLGRKTTTNVAA